MDLSWVGGVWSLYSALHITLHQWRAARPGQPSPHSGPDSAEHCLTTGNCGQRAETSLAVIVMTTLSSPSLVSLVTAQSIRAVVIVSLKTRVTNIVQSQSPPVSAIKPIKIRSNLVLYTRLPSKVYPRLIKHNRLFDLIKNHNVITIKLCLK